MVVCALRLEMAAKKTVKKINIFFIHVGLEIGYSPFQ
jgi:hypothetical protein